ncbi:hypothetical protein [Psychromarinibacter halotolerans]|uniref:Uncharacterized protein n=1 Tax=Psychromarinibacter halotolerans TaxID=1775175 RepID=A0ABV7GRS0_9RHOB|nr:hypothetical protein [Psychromarinibacter halotolerans]MDF0596661.1 hypothetical protein [Psychromarinibacter halotolerans]
MSRNDWHMIEGETLTLCRRLPPRFDVVAETAFPTVSRRRLARQVRQDVWRALQSVRGFSPVVEVSATDSGLRLRAGGRIDGGPVARAALEARLASLLAQPERRARWARYAGKVAR